LHKTYLAKKDIAITPEILLAMLPIAIQQVNIAFALKFNTDELSSGKNLLIVKVAENMVKRFLLAEKKYLEQNKVSIGILMLEEELESVVQIAEPQSGEIFNVKLHGKADRIDRVGGVTRIIDYKTGKVENKDLKIDLISNLREKDEPGKLLQVLSYALMYSDMQPVPPSELVSGIISLRKSSSYLIQTDIEKSDCIDKALLSLFRDELTDIIASIFDSGNPFNQTDDRDTCNLCAFNAICNRTVN
jgi:CRISPR/Cas system-associated exonuclease Cas4 (RecB family)